MNQRFEVGYAWICKFVVRDQFTCSSARQVLEDMFDVLQDKLNERQEHRPAVKPIHLHSTLLESSRLWPIV